MPESETMGHFSELCKVVNILQSCLHKSNGFGFHAQMFWVCLVYQELSHHSPYFTLTTTPFSKQGLRQRCSDFPQVTQEGGRAERFLSVSQSLPVSGCLWIIKERSDGGQDISLYFKRNIAVVVIWCCGGPRHSPEWKIGAWEWKSQVPHNLRSEK